MEAAAEGAVGLAEARDGSPLSVAAASDDGDTVVGVSYGMDSADMGTVPDNYSNLLQERHVDLYCVLIPPPPLASFFDAVAASRKSRLISASKEAGMLG